MEGQEALHVGEATKKRRQMQQHITFLCRLRLLCLKVLGALLLRRFVLHKALQLQQIIKEMVQMATEKATTVLVFFFFLLLLFLIVRQLLLLINLASCVGLSGSQRPRQMAFDFTIQIIVPRLTLFVTGEKEKKKTRKKIDCQRKVEEEKRLVQLRREIRKDLLDCVALLLSFRFWFLSLINSKQQV